MNHELIQHDTFDIIIIFIIIIVFFPEASLFLVLCLRCAVWFWCDRGLGNTQWLLL